LAQEASKLMTSSTSRTHAATAAPTDDVSSVRRAPGTLCRIAANAGVVISTSPTLSKRTASTRRTRCQRSSAAGASLLMR
jgi:hypothetical protein